MGSRSSWREGAGAQSAAAIRRGMDEFLGSAKNSARMAGLRWNLVPCGSRENACRRFREALNQTPESVATILLVDAEAEVTTDPREHLLRQDGWDLRAAPEDAVHLMAQIMETWIVADPEALAAYYGRNFNVAKLPRRTNLEEEPKEQVLKALKEATRRTRKGAYHKIKHGGAVLRQLDPARVQGRCRHCKRLFEELAHIIAAA